MSTVPHWIAGESHPAGPTTPVHDPATGQVSAQLHQADAAVVDRAVLTARSSSSVPGRLGRPGEALGQGA